MLYRITLLPLLLMLPLLAATPAHAESGHALRVDTVVRGVRLSLIVPRSAYPRGVLTRVTVRVQNISRQRLTVLPGCANELDNPKVESLTTNGTVRYPPAVPAIKGGPLLPPCTGGGSMAPGTLAPGASEQASVLVILGTGRLRAVVTLAPLGANNRLGRPFNVVGRALQVRLVQAPRTRVVRCSATYSCLQILPPPGARISGPLYFAYSSRCEDARGNVAYAQGPLVEPTASTTLHIGCGGHLAELHVVAGWLNQPVGRLDKFAPAQSGGAER